MKREKDCDQLGVNRAKFLCVTPMTTLQEGPVRVITHTQDHYLGGEVQFPGERDEASVRFDGIALRTRRDIRHPAPQAR